MYTNAIKTVVSIKSRTGQANSKGSNHPQRNSKGSSRPQAKATGQCNSRTKTGARELKTITGHNSIEAAVRADQAAPVDPVAVAGVVAAEAAAEEGKQLKSTLFF